MAQKTSTKFSILSLTLPLALTACGGGVDDDLDDVDAVDESADALTVLGAAAVPTTTVVATTAPVVKAPVIVARPASPTTMTASGAGWVQYQVSGVYRDTDTDLDTTLANKDVIIVRGLSGVSAAPLSAAAKSALTADVNAMMLASGAKSDTDVVYVVDRASAEGLGQPSTTGVVALASGCSDYTKDYPMSKSYSKSGALDKTWTSGDFVGSLKVNASSSGSAGATLKLKVKRGGIFGLCIPYAVGFVNVRLSGSATALADVDVSGNFRSGWQYSKEIAKPVIARFPFMVGPVPVLIGLNAPIEVGVGANAFAAASIKGQARADGSFDYTCTTHGCNGSKSSTAGFTPNGDPAGFVSGRVKVTPYVQAALRVYLYSDSILYGQVGLRPGVDFELFGYAGNDCGDANGDGTNEHVAGTSLDTALRVDLTAKAYAFGATWNTSWNLVYRHLGFWKSGGANTPWSPILKTAGTDMYTASVVAGTRPCWPYTDPVSFQVAWGDGASTPTTANPGVYTFTHGFSAAGTYPVSVSLGTDAQGRNLGTSASTNVFVSSRPRVVVDTELLAAQ